MTKNDIITAIEDDQWMIDILNLVKTLNLPDWWIGAGFVRSKVWDMLHGYLQRTPLPDIDIIYFDKSDFSENETRSNTTKKEEYYEKLLKGQRSEINWSVTNQARMHLFHNDQPYNTSEEALAHWVETATCIGVRLDKNNKVTLTAPHGTDDLLNLVLRPTSSASKNMKTFSSRVKGKQWLTKWPKLKIAVI